ncbi:hypothetical protein MACH18_20450 [Phaeobacter italicus]|uniref:hypothetical protein n=1 Tax=Phaeobacter italicus TaxID=481446 RepID=UPI00276E9F57|nr:hypothetical protein [Phaeobacter italicus]GLO74965.1 hypothetical protein MACH18_20450 [Phaeobacter italicus]
MRFLWVVTAAFGFAASAGAGERADPLNVRGWLDGCAGLSTSNIADEMDRNCIGLAYDYCEMGRAHEERRPCIVSLNEHAKAQTAQLISVLPETVEGYGVFQQRRYSETLDRLQNVTTATDCTQMPKLHCESFRVMSRWLDARNLARMASKLEGTGE